MPSKQRLQKIAKDEEEVVKENDKVTNFLPCVLVWTAGPLKELHYLCDQCIYMFCAFITL